MKTLMHHSLIVMITRILVIVGALNWGLVGLMDINLVTLLLPMGLAKIVYILVGISAIFVAMNLLSNQCSHYKKD
jgi:hypothetical protein